MSLPGYSRARSALISSGFGIAVGVGMVVAVEVGVSVRVGAEVKVWAGGAVCDGSGEAGLFFTLQANTNLNSPNWMNISTSPADTNSALHFVDTNAGNFAQRFYRIVPQQ